MMRRAFCLCMLALAIVLGPTANAFANKRVALLIGNSAYETLGPRKTSAANVAAMKAAFEKAGFDSVDTVLDLKYPDLTKKLQDFQEAAKNADIAAVYYAGHSIETQGESYLVPVDAKLKSEGDLEVEAIALSRVTTALDGAKKLRLVLLDASREDVFPNRKTNCCVTGAESDKPMLVFYAVKAGAAAAEGDQPVSPFAKALASRLFQPKEELMQAVRAVRDDVMAATTGAQEPFAYGSLAGEIYVAK